MTLPVPEPPVVARVIGVPAVAVVTVVEMTSGAWAAAVKANETATDRAEP